MIQAETQPQNIHFLTRPTVSVIIPAYNSARYIGESLSSVFQQTFKSYEVIVINDGSHDTLELERELQPYFDRIEYLPQENKGAAAARNAGLRVARGEFVAFLDADDKWLPTFLEEQIEFLKSNNADFVYSDALLTGESTSAGRTFMQVQPSRGPVTPEALLSLDVTVLTSVVVARREPILQVGLFDETMKRGHDFDLWLRLAKHGVRFAYQCKVLGEHRIVESGLSGNFMSQLERTFDVLKAIKTREVLTPKEEDALQHSWDRTVAELAVENGKEKLLSKDFAGALECFQEAKKFRQTWKLILVCLGLKIAPQTLWRIYHWRNNGRATA